MLRVPFIFLLLCISPLSADTFVASKAQPWHPATHVSKWGILEDPLAENAGFVEGKDQTGATVRFQLPLIVARFDLPGKGAPTNLSTDTQHDALKAQGEALEKFLAAHPSFTKHLAPYLNNYKMNVVPALAKYKEGNTLEGGVWLTQKDRETRAQKIAREEAARNERVREAAEAAKQRQSEARATAQAERDADKAKRKEVFLNISKALMAGRVLTPGQWRIYFQTSESYSALVENLGRPDFSRPDSLSPNQKEYKWFGKVDNGTRYGGALLVIREVNSYTNEETDIISRYSVENLWEFPQLDPNITKVPLN